MRQKDKKFQRGYSLVELMTTVTIIGALAGMAIPTYMSQIKLSRQMMGEHEVKQVNAELKKDFESQIMRGLYVSPARLDPNPDGTRGGEYRLMFSVVWPPGSQDPGWLKVNESCYHLELVPGDSNSAIKYQFHPGVGSTPARLSKTSSC